MTGTPLERHREANSDQCALTAIRERIEAACVEYVCGGEALTTFREDMVVRSALGDELSDLLGAYKTDEWARSCGAVADWEFQMYAEAAP
jgi:glutamine synthetase